MTYCSPGNTLKIFFISIIFVMKLLKVICIRFNSISGKINPQVESTRNADWASEPQSDCDRHPTCLGFRTASTHHELSILWRDWSLEHPQYLLVFLDLSSNLYTPKPGERKSLEDNTHYCFPNTMWVAWFKLIIQVHKETNKYLLRLSAGDIHKILGE